MKRLSLLLTLVMMAGFGLFFVTLHLIRIRTAILARRLRALQLTGDAEDDLAAE